jgi:hypothetical protein
MTLRSVAVLAVLAVPVLPSGAAPVAVPTEERAAAPWHDSWSVRYPGCVPAVLWPAQERPVAVVTRTADGELDRVALDARRRPVERVPADARTVGVCR